MKPSTTKQKSNRYNKSETMRISRRLVDKLRIIANDDDVFLRPIIDEVIELGLAAIVSKRGLKVSLLQFSASRKRSD